MKSNDREDGYRWFCHEKPFGNSILVVLVGIIYEYILTKGSVFLAARVLHWFSSGVGTQQMFFCKNDSQEGLGLFFLNERILLLDSNMCEGWSIVLKSKSF